MNFLRVVAIKRKKILSLFVSFLNLSTVKNLNAFFSFLRFFLKKKDIFLIDRILFFKSFLQRQDVWTGQKHFFNSPSFPRILLSDLNNGRAEYKLCKISRTISSTKISLSLGIPASFSKRFKVLFSVYGAPFYYSLNRGSQWNIQRHDFAFFRGVQRRATNTLYTLEQLKNARLTTISRCFVAPPGRLFENSRSLYPFHVDNDRKKRIKAFFFESFETSNTCRDDFMECDRKSFEWTKGLRDYNVNLNIGKLDGVNKWISS